MQDQDAYDQWAERHARVFRLATPSDVAMLGEWCRLFEQGGYRPDELERATDWLALHAPPTYPGDHLQALLACLQRHRAGESAGPPEDPRGTCADCDGSGRVVVPRVPAHPGGLWYTWAVLCHCALGRWYGERLAGRSPLTLEVYEQANPDWRRQARDHHWLQIDQADALQRANPGGLGRALDELLKRLRQRLREARGE